MDIMYPTLNIQYLKELNSHYCHFLPNVLNVGVCKLEKKSIHTHTLWKHLL